MARRQLTLDNQVAAELAGSADAVLRELEERVDCALYLRGNVLTLEGDPGQVSSAETIVDELVGLIERGHEIAPDTIDTVTGALDQDESPSRVLEDTIWRHRGTKVAPKTVNQKRYVDSIRNHTITFGIGPAGTGKTFLAVAMAVAALEARDVSRVILTRPAVEAGERLGFLPGDIQAKVDPYLRPLFDALYDMLDPDRVNAYFEKGIIEVAPLAFMRGRAQPVSSPVLTPTGYRPIGSLQVGDLVIGSSGTPTPVLGIYPQGRKQVFRVGTQDGAATLCCSKHLWQVRTPSDHRRGKPGRVLETGEMARSLRQAHQHRYELPLLSSAAEFSYREVPMDAYALGHMLGNWSRATSTSGSDVTSNSKTVNDRSRGGAIVADSLTTVPRSLGLADARPWTTFVPGEYCWNSSAVRLAVLQGLLDTVYGRPTGRGRIQYTTQSARLCDDITFLVRSLGGLTYSQRRTAGPASSRAVAFILDIRLPEGIQPFRLARKRELFDRDGGGRPMRFIDSIEPQGEEETVCIQVAAADSLYVTDDFLLTHNTINDAFVILDEAQNTSPEQMKMFLTRLGFGSRMAVTGDVTQIDLPRDQRSGLVVIGEILAEIDDIAFVRFGGEDVVRHQLVQRIVAAYGVYSERNEQGSGGSS